MIEPRGWLALLVVLVACGPAAAQAEEVPGEAQAVIEEFRRAERAIRKQAEERLRPVRKKAVERLQALQDKYCRAARLDEALAVREAIRALQGIRPDPGQLRVTPDEIGKSYLFEVTGSTEGAVWGSEVYTSDSHLGTAAVHAGLLAPGRKGVVRVRVIEGQQSYRASTRNGVTSRAWGKWNASFTLEPARL